MLAFKFQIVHSQKSPIYMQPQARSYLILLAAFDIFFIDFLSSVDSKLVASFLEIGYTGFLSDVKCSFVLCS